MLAERGEGVNILPILLVLGVLGRFFEWLQARLSPITFSIQATFLSGNRGRGREGWGEGKARRLTYHGYA
jgi:hypothetical protein